MRHFDLRPSIYTHTCEMVTIIRRCGVGGVGAVLPPRALTGVNESEAHRRFTVSY